MINKVINLSSLFNSSSLITRQAAREVFDMISHSPESTLILDFSNIQFASRSFFDELHGQQSKVRLLGKKVEFINMDDNLQKLLNLVADSSRSRTSTTYSSVAKANTLTI